MTKFQAKLKVWELKAGNENELFMTKREARVYALENGIEKPEIAQRVVLGLKPKWARKEGA